MPEIILGIIIGMYIMYELIENDVKFEFKWNWDDDKNEKNNDDNLRKEQ